MKTIAIPDTHERFVDVKGAINLRDFGGYHNDEGKLVKRGLLFRCGSMTDIPESAYQDFADLDIGVICDLRSEDEAESSPTPECWPFDCRVHIPIWPGSSTQFQQTSKNKRPDHNDFMAFMKRVTEEIARDHVESYKQLMRELVNTERGFLLHCTAGKDRTGFGAALILTVLGVDRETITHDYLVSNEASEIADRMKARMKESAEAEGRVFKMDDSVIRIMAGVREEYLHGAFEEIDQHYGGIHGYLEAIGITAADEDHLKERLLES